MTFEDARESHILRFEIRRVTETRVHDEMPGLLAVFFNSLQHVRMKRMQEIAIAEDERDYRRRIPRKALSPGIGPVVQFVQGATNAGPQLTVHIRAAID